MNVLSALKKVTLTTDGACNGNPGPGGFAAVLNFGGHEKVITSHEVDTTNNRMELTPVIAGLEAVKCRCEVEVVSDSKYVTDAFNAGWLEGWVARGWWKADRKSVENRDLWERLLGAVGAHRVTFTWVKGHAGNAGNSRVDALGVAARDRAN